MKNLMDVVRPGPAPGLARVADDIVAATTEAGEQLERFSDASLLSARDALEQAQASLSGAAKAFTAAADGHARSHPWQAIGAAAVAGLLIGLLLTRR